MTNKNKPAFTLAETLINKINMFHYKALLKENYALMTKAHMAIAAENGSFRDGLSYCPQNTNTCLKNAFKKHLKVAKDCDTNNGKNKNKCFISQSEVKNLDGSAASSLYFNGDRQSALLLNNGASVAFWNDSPTCTYTWGDYCGWFVLDVNGPKKPNTWGKDIYKFAIYNSKIVPSRADSTSNCTTNGISCAYEYLK